MPGASTQTHQQIVTTVRRSIFAHLLASRRLRQALSFLAVAVAVGAGILPARTVQADDGWSCYFDFDIDSYSPLVTAINGGTGDWDGSQWLNNHEIDGPDGFGLYNRQAGIYVDFPETGNLTSVSLSYDLTKGTFDAAFLHDFVEFGAPGGGDHVGQSNGANIEETFDGFSLDLDNITLQVFATRTASSGAAADGSAAINWMELAGGGENPFEGEDVPCSATEVGWTRPLSAADEDPAFGVVDWTGQDAIIGIWDQWGILSSGAENTVEAFSQTGYANVYAAQGGTIHFDRLLNCGDYCAVLAPPTFDDPIFERYKLVDNNDLFVVRIDRGLEDELQYVVRDADTFLVQGMTIEQGCILGKTVQLESVGSIPAPDVQVALISLVDPDDDIGHELLSKLTEYPTEAEACNADPRFADCLAANPQFLLNGDGWWTTGSSVSFVPTGGALLSPGASVLQILALPDAPLTLDSNVTLNADGLIRMWIGDESYYFDLQAGAPQNIQLDVSAPVGANAFGTYEIGIENLTGGEVFVNHLCITGEDPTSTPGNCYFENPGFDLAGAYWDNDAYAVVPGYMTLEDGQTASQPVKLNPGNYRITAVGYLELTTSEQPGSGSATLSFEYPDGDGFSDVGTIDYTSPWGQPATLQVEFEVTGATDDVLTFMVDVDPGEDMDVAGLVVDSLCLETLDEPFPPYDGGDGGVVDPPFNADCQFVPRPTFDASVQQWLNYHWGKLNQFFQCDLMIVLDQIYVQMVNGINTMLRFARFVIIAAQRQAAWVGSDLIPWLGGYLNNISLGRTTTIIQDVGASECHDIFCLLTAVIERVLSPLVDAVTEIVHVILGILTQVVSLLLNIVTSFIGVAIGIVGQLIYWVLLLIRYLLELINLFNHATPIPLPGVPQCQLDPQGNAVCIGLWMLENTVFADEGQLYIPLLIGAMSLGLLFWLITTIRKELMNIGDKL
jgi:hypothetical protein